MIVLDMQDCFILICYGDVDVWIEVVVVEMVEFFNQEIIVFGCVCMLLFGGIMLVLVYQVLVELDVYWDCVEVSLVDECWLFLQDCDSNVWLVCESFFMCVEGVYFDLLVWVGKLLVECVYIVNLQVQYSQWLCLSVLGMGNDGYIVLLFFGFCDLVCVVDSILFYVVLDVIGCLGVNQWLLCIILILYGFGQSWQCLLLLCGKQKLDVLCQVLDSNNLYFYFIFNVIDIGGIKLCVYWCD